MSDFDVKKLLRDVFQPDEREVVTVMTDLPHGNIEDNEVWKRRREEMTPEWHNGFVKLANEIGFKLNPIVKYNATGSNGAALPEIAQMGGEEVNIEDLIKESTIIVSFAQFSATAPLYAGIQKYPKLRVASMPHSLIEMEETGLAVDFKELQKLAAKLGELLQPAIGGEVIFSTGHKCYFDLRYRNITIDNALLPPVDKAPKGIRLSRMANLPAGEAFKPCYEGEREGEPSKTRGELATYKNGEIFVVKVEENMIVDVVGDGPEAAKMKEFFFGDYGRQNIAEFGLGCNDKAIMRDNPLEDEKAGFHWAYGMSAHFVGSQGAWGADKFEKAENVVHMDRYYPKGAPVTVNTIELFFEDGSSKVIWEGDWYTV
jgi:leucyl aminopeptidase (aminopeptidase T)